MATDCPEDYCDMFDDFSVPIEKDKYIEKLEAELSRLRAALAANEAVVELLRDLEDYFASGERAVANGGMAPPWDGMRFRALRGRVAAAVAALPGHAGGKPTEKGMPDAEA